MCRDIAQGSGTNSLTILSARHLKPRLPTAWARFDNTQNIKQIAYASCREAPAARPNPRYILALECFSNVDGNNFGEWAGCDQWSAGTTPEMGRRCHFHRACDGLARHGDREHRSSRNSSRSSCQPIRSHLGSECLPDCDGRNPFAARRAWRSRRSPPDLPRRPCAVHVGVAVLRVCVVVAQPADGARAAGPRRRWYYECEYGAGSLRLSRALAGSGFRTQRDGGRDRLHARPDDRFGHPRDWTVELAVRHQHPLRRRCDLDRFEDIAAHPESSAWFRFSRRTDGGGLSRPFHSGDRKRGPPRAARADID